MLTLKREDTEIALFSLALGSMATFAGLRAGQSFGDAALGGAVIASGATALIYGGGVLARSLPTAAATAFEFRKLAHTQDQAMPRFRPVAPEAEVTESDSTVEHRWRMALRQFLLAGKFAGGLTIRTLTAKGFVTDNGYRVFSGVLKSNGILCASKAGTDYAPLWNYGRACFALRNDTLTLPEGEPPQIKF